MIPAWLHWLSLVSLVTGVLSAIYMIALMRRNSPHMAVMAWVWPLCALFGGPLLIWFYHRYGTRGADENPFPATVAKGTLHCGAGCSLADLVAENIVHFIPALLPIFGLGWLFSEEIFAAWVFDYILALATGIVFQYFAIAPMRGLALGEGLVVAAKVDTLSLTAWQVGMYGLMAIAHFWLFADVLQTGVDASQPLFWFAMQLAMLAGFVTSFPMNWLLIKTGIKEAM